MWFILDTAASHSSLTTRGLHDLPGGDRRATADLRSLKSLGGTFLSKKVTGLVVQTSAVKFTGIEFPVIDRVNPASIPVPAMVSTPDDSKQSTLPPSEPPGPSQAKPGSAMVHVPEGLPQMKSL